MKWLYIYIYIYNTIQWIYVYSVRLYVHMVVQFVAFSRPIIILGAVGPDAIAGKITQWSVRWSKPVYRQCGRERLSFHVRNIHGALLLCGTRGYVVENSICFPPSDPLHLPLLVRRTYKSLQQYWVFLYSVISTYASVVFLNWRRNW